MLQNEHGQAANIKSKGHRKNVQGAIESAISTLNRFKTPGENGIALFVGAIIIGNNKTRMVNVVVDDPHSNSCHSDIDVIQRLNSPNLRICWWTKSHTHCSSLIEQKQHTALLQARESTFKNILVSNIMGKHRQGGQSAQRFERLIEETAHNFFKRATEHACSYWLPNLENIQAVIIGGPGATKDFVVKNDYFHHEIAKKIAKPHLMLDTQMKAELEN